MDCARICVSFRSFPSFHRVSSMWMVQASTTIFHTDVHGCTPSKSRLRLPLHLHVMALVIAMRRDELAVAFVDVCDDSIHLRIVERLRISADPAIATVRNASVHCKRKHRPRRGELTRTDECSTSDVR